eukprot:TRINITY_DN37921_c0_g1_i1.p1 TRINITY_DN37921_c0_g1~~TRINITY_DN37921_c0_g1_i1.p1  ORF type:complete len:552 (+),score=98.12 TRINITY_DN37921_c0_g1_i1:107-1762(+)
MGQTACCTCNNSAAASLHEDAEAAKFNAKSEVFADDLPELVSDLKGALSAATPVTAAGTSPGPGSVEGAEDAGDARLSDAWRLLSLAVSEQSEGNLVEALASICRVARLIQELHEESPSSLETASDAEQFRRLRERYDRDKDVRRLVMRRASIQEIHRQSLGDSPVGQAEDGQEPKLLFLEGDMLPQSVKELMLPVEALQDELARFESLCREGRLFDAEKVLRKLEDAIKTDAEEVEASPTACPTPSSGVSVRSRQLAELGLKISECPMVGRLRDVHARMARITNQLNNRPFNAKDGWAHTKVHDKSISQDFQADIYLRFAQGAERVPDGQSAQLICNGVLKSFPMGMTEFVSIYRETDLYKKEWLADCECCEGSVGGPEKLYSAYSRFLNSSPLMPRKLEIVTVRDFAVCPQAPINGQPAGVMVMDSSAPTGSSEFGGFAIPGPLARTTRIADIDTMLYFSPSKEHPGTVDVFATAYFGAPIPQWIIPLTLVKKFFANHFLSVFKAIKTHISGDWDKLQYKDRISSSPQFYGLIQKLAAGSEKCAEEDAK